ncbi:cadherin-23-like isoform X2 [Haliotis rufescens]|uniref:cadherin-23-like isoform X2 n=1 Tax=Haliotis rufescens TaxID=6454 RepID=UPI00201E86E0|nr:cadherin-23-like isoform X2 [Haliotis rufescens]
MAHCISQGNTSRLYVICVIVISTIIGTVVSNSPPQLRNFGGVIIWPEDTPIDTVLGNLTAVDFDGPEDLTFKTSTDETKKLVSLSAPRKVDADTWIVDIVLKAALDRDYEPSERKLFFSIDDSTSEVPARVSLFIRDVNDVRPQFKDMPYKATINESEVAGSVVFTGVSATDPDNGRGGTIQYSMETDAQAADEDYRTTFQIDQYSGVIKIIRPLDYEKHNFYQFKIKAVDGYGLEGEPADFVVTVLDVQDTPPYFINLPYSAEVDENVTVGTAVQQVSGLDGDRGIPNNLTYSFVSGDYQNFDLDPHSGWVTVKHPLDRDSQNVRNRGGVYAFYVEAAEQIPLGQVNTNQTTETTLVTITVRDINDNDPVFSQPSYNASILENMQNGVPITFQQEVMRVSDADQGTNSHFELHIQKDGQPYEDFLPLPSEVYAESTVLIRVNNSQELDYEKNHQLVFEVVAKEMDTEERRSSTATVTVNIEDMNDNAPVFANDTYLVTLKENTPIETSVALINATDEDSGIFGTVRYTIRGGNNKFRIGLESGVIYVSGDLDRETTDEYYLTAEAKDGGGLRTPVEVKVVIEDVNDNAPMFRRQAYEGTVRERDVDFLRPLMVEALDDDEAFTNNSEVRYRIDSVTPGLESNFSIDPVTGRIWVQDPLDYEKLDPTLKGKVTMQVMAYDLGEPQKTSLVQVDITVEDVNDNAPIFEEDLYTVSVPENSTQGSVLLNVTATDLDIGSPNNEFIYRIESGAMDKFRIDFETGSVFVETGAKLDREDKNVYIMNVSAIDKGTPPQTGRCVVIIHLTDVNDKLPVFTPESQSKTVMENLGIGTTVLTYNATDADLNSELEYSVLKSLTKAYNDRNDEVDVVASNITEYFDVYPNNGTVYVASQLDRETAERVVIKVLVRDINAWEPVDQTATATLTVTLEDYNDNAPLFLPTPMYSANISEGQDVDSEALRVETVDPDKNQQVTYTINDRFEAFKIDPRTGIIRLKRKLDREARSSLQFTVIATDNGVPAQSSSAVVFVTVLDTNDNSPVFLPHNRTARVSEDANVGHVVVTLGAIDSDIGNFGKVFYLLDGVNNDGTFVINESNGEITVDKPLDRESQDEYTLVVVARDNQKEPQDQRSNRTSILIQIEDVNDNAPQFAVIGSQSIPESSPLGSSVYQIVATDNDAGDNGTVVYSLEGDSNATNNRNQALFGINAVTGIISVQADLHNTVGVRYVTVRAKDMGSPQLSNSTTLFLQVLDVNDDAPRFVVPDPDNPVVVIKEDQPVGTHIITLQAQDDDFGRNGEVVYTLVETESRLDWQKFHVDSLTGNLTNREVLDRETHESYELLVRATDRGVPRNYSTDLTLTVRVKDVNDEKPKFDRTLYPTPYPVAVAEESDSACAGNISIAKDNDINFNFTIICYYIYAEEIPGAFTLNKTGELCLKKKLDREQLKSTHLIIQASPFCYEDIKPKTFVRPAPGEQPQGYDSSDLTLLWVNVTIKDINDNPPQFNRKDLVLGVTRSTQFGQIIFELKTEVTDKDSRTWGVNKFDLSGNIGIEPEALRNELAEMGVDKPFLVFPNGSLKTNTYFKPTMFGSFLLNLAVYDKGGLNDSAQLKISLINDDQRLKVVFRRRLEDVSSVKDFFTERLRNITGYRIVVDKISTHENDQGKPEIEKTDMLIHGEDPKTDKVIPAEDLLKSIDFNAEHMIGILNDYNIERIVPTSSTTPQNSSEKELKMALILVSVILGMLLVVVIVTFYMSRRKYQRKLKAATAMAYGSQDSDLYKLEMPGTNIHSYENANPIYLEKILLDQVDDDGQNSLDENAVDPGQPFDEQEVSMNIFPEDKDFTNSLSSTDLYLKAALNEHETSRNLKNHDISKKFQHTNGKLKITNGHAHKDNDVITTRNVDGLQTTEI